MMRIVIMTPSLGEVFGQERVVRDSARLLRAAGHQVFCVTDQLVGNVEDYDGVEVLNGITTLHQLTVPSRVNEMHERALKFIDSVKPDVIHLIDQFDYRLTRVLAERYPLIFSSHSVAATCPASCRLIHKSQVCNELSGWKCLKNDLTFECLSHLKGPGRKVHAVHNYLLRREATRRATRVIAVSNYIKEVLVHDGWNKAQIDVVYNPVTVLPETKPFAGTPKNLITVASRLHSLKGIEFLLKGLAGKVNLDWTLWICGEGPLRESLQKLARELGIGHRVDFKGQTSYSDTQRIVAASRLFVQSNVGPEAFGLAAAEASALGIPVVAFDVPALNEIVEDGVTGLLVNRASASSLGDAIQSLLENEVLARRLGQNGSRRIAKLFSPAAHLKSTLAVYEACARDHAQSTITPQSVRMR